MSRGARLGLGCSLSKGAAPEPPSPSELDGAPHFQTEHRATGETTGLPISGPASQGHSSASAFITP